ncbi:hypothetical protein OPKNFCMD_1452 [Methylobacterium crusticola]|uniref:BPL/LPL catalytic domain-containing protein n=1 Tax=Methylobacterium crusticola TaxID=1697972 RepID=A0ABQ4QTS1_9HYPH|nr:biotin/lipoate--protein ligase family protein [Methylobacterium crusticola]GJD48728.1 hypothetical protein OPKNFCMD_1452 [Methylobacterium crusticola]
MIAADAPALVLPPPFRAVTLRGREDAHARACALAEAGPEAGTLVVGAREAVVDLAVVLCPGEPLRVARLAGLVGLAALAEAVGSLAPPDKPVTLDWPDTLRFDRARLGGGRLACPPACGEDAVPAWLVFSAMLIASKREAGDPGLTPDSTSLEEEGFPARSREPLVESFARHLMKGLEVWAEDGVPAAAARILPYLPRERPSVRWRIAPDGAACREEPGRETLRLPFRPDGAAWLDPARGGPRL